MNRRIVKFMKAFWDKFSSEGIPKESAALTFVTILGFVPFLIFILFLLPELPFLQIETQLKDIIISIFVPESAEQISEYIGQLVNQKIPFNLFNFIILLITSFSLFKIINDSFDNILNVHELRKKGVITNIVRFFGMTVFGGLLLLILFSATSIPIVNRFVDFPFLQKLSLYLTPVVLLFIIFTLGFSLIPTIKIRKRSIFFGSVFSTLIWILFKSLFNWYIATLTNIELIFGVLASVPIFLFWIYANWIIILSGVVIVSILENRHIKRHIGDEAKQKIKVTFEKIDANNEYDSICSTSIKPSELKEILSKIVEEEPEKE
jgi:membrane protein